MVFVAIIRGTLHVVNTNELFNGVLLITLLRHHSGHVNHSIKELYLWNLHGFELSGWLYSASQFHWHIDGSVDDTLDDAIHW